MNTQTRPLAALSQTRALTPFAQTRPVRYSGVLVAVDAVAVTTLLEMDWDEGTAFYSFAGVRTASSYYQDLMLSLSPIMREVALLGGSFSAGHVRVSLSNRSQTLSAKLGTQNPMGRALRVFLLLDGDGFGSRLKVFAGSVTHWELGRGILTLEARDTKYVSLFDSRITEKVPTVDQSLFPNVPDGQVNALVPLVYGRSTSPFGTDVGGASPAYLVETAASPNAFRYVVAARATGLGGFTVNSAYRYGIKVTPDAVTTATYGSITFRVFEFIADQRDTTRPNELEITTFLDGFTENDLTSETPIFNPVRALEHFLTNYSSILLTDFDTALQNTAKTRATAQRIADANVTNVIHPSMDAIITDGTQTYRDVIERFAESFALQLYATREGLLATFVDTDDSDPAPALTLTDEADILRDSFVVRSNDDVASTLQYNYAFRSVYGKRGDVTFGSTFQRQPDYVIPGELTQLGRQAVRKSLPLHFVMGTRAALQVARTYADYFRSASQWMEFDVPLRFFRQLDLNQYVGITHWQGTGSGGAVNRVARIVGLETNPITSKIHLKCFAKPVATGAKDIFDRADSLSLGTGWTESETAPGALQIVSSLLNMLSQTNAVALRTETYRNNQWSSMRVRSNIFVTGGLVVRGSGSVTAFTGYAVVHDPVAGTLTLKRYVAEGVQLGTTLATTTKTFAVPDILELRVEGTSLNVYVASQLAGHQGRVIGPITDALIAAGAPGILNVSSTSPTPNLLRTWDDFQCKDF